MKRMLVAGLLTAALAINTVTACPLPIRIACPNGSTAAGIRVEVWNLDIKVGEGVTDSLGMTQVEVPWMPAPYKVCVDESTLPAGSSLKKACLDVKVENPAPPVLEFTLGGTFCSTNPPSSGQCWLTGGGTIAKVKGTPNYSFGGVVYPGCSPKAADGGNLNVVDHFNDMHFQGQKIIVDGCSGVSTRSPRVNVNIIDFHGEGVLKSATDANSTPIPVTFEGRAVDNLESGGGSDMLYLKVSMGSTVVMQIGNSAVDPSVISTGNLQIHTTSCK